LLHAKLLNRTLILPSFLYARGCEFPLDVCGTFAPMVNRGDAIGWPEWRNLSKEEQAGWRIPIELMLDLPTLRRNHNVILMSEYLQMMNLSPTLESSSGMWQREAYHQGNVSSLYIIPNDEFDPPGVVLVDTFPNTGMQPSDVETVLSRQLMSMRLKSGIVDWDDAVPLIRTHHSELAIEAELLQNGWVATYTYFSGVAQELFKGPIDPIKQIAPVSSIRGLAEQYGNVTEDVLLLAGETHLYRKAGGLRFMSAAARDDFTNLILRDIKPGYTIHNLAAAITDRMKEKVYGRMWMSAHMRRGDFARLGWINATLEDHLHQVKEQLRSGRQVLKTLRASDLETYEIPGVVADTKLLSRYPPGEDDPFFLMTDERSQAGLEYLRANGAIMIQDLLEPEDRQDAGWPIIFTDVLALAEQLVAVQSDFFYGQAFSSVTGGIITMRAARGVDPRTQVMD